MNVRNGVNFHELCHSYRIKRMCVNGWQGRMLNTLCGVNFVACAMFDDKLTGL